MTCDVRVANGDVLLVEDNPGDARLVEIALDEMGTAPELRVVNDGGAALDTLESHCEGGEALPSLVLLDLDLPVTDGRTVLKQVKSDPALSAVPVVVFTGSEDRTDVEEAYDSGANAYVLKPQDVDQYRRVVQRTVRFWLSPTTATPVDV